MASRFGAVLAVIALSLLGGCSNEASPDAKSQIENPRTAKFKAISKANKAIGQELKKDAPSMEVIAANTKTLDGLAQQLPTWFTGTTGPETNMETEALPTIWQKPAEFKAAADKFSTATAALNAAAINGDLAQVKAAAAVAAPTCKNCHQTFRQKK